MSVTVICTSVIQMTFKTYVYTFGLLFYFGKTYVYMSVTVLTFFFIFSAIQVVLYDPINKLRERTRERERQTDREKKVMGK